MSPWQSALVLVRQVGVTAKADILCVLIAEKRYWKPMIVIQSAHLGKILSGGVGGRV